MVISTVDERGYPDSRVVLLREFNQGQFIFYTNYNSVKGKQIELCPHVALNFYWPLLSRQVRVKGLIEKVSPEKSSQYFDSRPLAHRVSSIVSQQSSVISSRQELEQQIQELLLNNSNIKQISRPDHWGGYAVTPTEMEFWQGRDDRLSDRIQYVLESHGVFRACRLAP